MPPACTTPLDATFPSVPARPLWVHARACTCVFPVKKQNSFSFSLIQRSYFFLISLYAAYAGANRPESRAEDSFGMKRIISESRGWVSFFFLNNFTWLTPTATVRLFSRFAGTNYAVQIDICSSHDEEQFIS